MCFCKDMHFIILTEFHFIKTVRFFDCSRDDKWSLLGILLVLQENSLNEHAIKLAQGECNEKTWT